MLKAHLKVVAQLAAYSLSASLCIGGNLGDNGRLIYSRTLTHDGFDPATKWPAVGDFSTIRFLSEDRILVSINQGTRDDFCKAAERTESTLVVVDLLTGAVKSKPIGIIKRADNAASLSSERFAVSGSGGMQICDRTLICDSAIEVFAPLLTSPSGNKLLVGGNCHSKQRQFDSILLKEVSAQFPVLSDLIIPGDRNLLVQSNRHILITGVGEPNATLGDDTGDNWRKTRFLSVNTFGRFSGVSEEAVVASSHGRDLFRLPVSEPWKAEFVVSGGGRVFGISRYGYSALSRVMHLFGLLDIDGTRRPDIQNIRLFRSDGQQILDDEWDPLGHYIRPALSPSGRRIATIRMGVLEVFSLPGDAR